MNEPGAMRAARKAPPGSPSTQYASAVHPVNPYKTGERHLATVSPPPPHPGDRRALTREFARGGGGRVLELAAWEWCTPGGGGGLSLGDCPPRDGGGPSPLGEGWTRGGRGNCALRQGSGVLSLYQNCPLSMSRSSRLFGVVERSFTQCPWKGPAHRSNNMFQCDSHYRCCACAAAVLKCWLHYISYRIKVPPPPSCYCPPMS